MYIHEDLFLKAGANYQLSAEQLRKQILSRKEGELSDTGALVIQTGKFTGRSPADKFIVRDSLTDETVDWNRFNNPIAENQFDRLLQDMTKYLGHLPELWARDAYACDDPALRIRLRTIAETPAASHFAANMFIPPEAGELKGFAPDWHLLHAPGFHADPGTHGTRQGNFTVVSFSHNTILIGGTGYTGELKKAVFTILNYLLPLEHNVLSMHCSANEGTDGDCALFFGLSGTGKTTLSSDPVRRLIGDDEHGWHDTGIFNFEGGCYAKVINLSEAQEPAIFRAIRPGALIENTRFIQGTNRIDFSDGTITENTRVSYPLDFIPQAKKPAVSGIPRHIFFLTCDAYGVLPPLSKLSPEQATYYFLNGYIAKVAGTEAGVLEPQATFSTCFGAPFLPLAPKVYARLLLEKITRYGTSVWMINTGWTGGPYGTGTRIKLSHTRAMITAVLSDKLDAVPYHTHEPFGLLIPQRCPEVAAELLDPKKTWTNPGDYDLAASKLQEKFSSNFLQFKEKHSPGVTV
ncbi:phosphoenolpyruvate carboxykinase (ATP) [Mucilaginibacter sp. SMC90]|uniref:phosphoenolpyruvate carboxykinase (ATP) n=1 Tax=Mucilaginibacter sp. SMC90 TaxID=2929803 RepID=UPI001FB2DDD7|nr:phosphoenolpyruvate carboxykinase (ATP) [Mucilaginibacter sp. SMC90]UOE51001.1 phosphoenolpyruvate carboxykinase (ATP) [Mucilaginibacter sp. SMC90]